MRYTLPLLIVPLLAGSWLHAEVRMHRLPERALHPQAAVDGQGRVHLIYFQGDDRRIGNIYYVHSEDGRTWSEPLQVNSQDRSAYADSVRGPHLAIGREGRVHIAWMGSDEAQPRAPGNGRPMLYSRLNDNGLGFEPQRNVIQKQPGLDGGGSIAADAGGNVYIAWHAPAAAGSHDEASRRVWLTHSSDDGATFAAETPASPEGTGACACCSLRIFCIADGRLFIFYRIAEQRTNRDAVLLASDGAGSGFVQLLRHEWSVATCPMSSFAMVEAGGGVRAAWETQGQIYLTQTGPTMKPGEPVAAPGRPERRKHPSIAANADGQILLAWVDSRGWGRDGVLRWQLLDAAGNPVRGESGRAEGFSVFSVPAVFASPDGGFTIVH
jgi:hypothetical protein